MRIIKIFIIGLCIIITLSTKVFAIGEILNVGESWEITGLSNANTTLNTENLNDISSQLYNIFLVSAIVVALIVGAFLGIKYMSAGVSEKVQVKESLFPYIVSCIVVFGSLGIWKLGVTILSQISK